MISAVLASRLRAASRAALIHLFCGMAVLGLVAVLIFFVWYPYPYHEISGGSTLFLLLSSVDLVCGPILTLILFDPQKSRKKWLIDITLILIVQLLALAYGLSSIFASRPVWLAFEGDRFRVVRAVDVREDLLNDKVLNKGKLSWTGPRLVSINALDRSSPAFLESVQNAMQGNPPAFQPERWTFYESRKSDILSALWPIDLLKHQPGYEHVRTEIKRVTGLTTTEQDAALGYLPMVQEATTDWIAIVSRSNGMPLIYFHVDGW